jgi:hypothetical protein
MGLVIRGRRQSRWPGPRVQNHNGNTTEPSAGAPVEHRRCGDGEAPGTVDRSRLVGGRGRDGAWLEFRADLSRVTLTCQPFAAGARSRGGRLNGPCRADGFDRGDT